MSTNMPPITTATPATTTPRIFHVMLTFRCPSTLAEALTEYGARIGTKSVSRAIRELLQQALTATQPSSDAPHGGSTRREPAA